MPNRRSLILGFLAASGAALAGCGPKVDCERLGARLNDCTPELMFTLNPAAKRQLEKVIDPDVRKENDRLHKEDIERNRKTLKEQVTDKCKAHKGRAADAKLILKCLEAGAKDCKQFAACFAGYLRNKSK
ncbi:MAG: hypothetical protein RBU30_08020 [Polyangia bacterium]|jgi:hypothetical protein|nr:hypothetical protein [Polyangia bacterium]